MGFVAEYDFETLDPVTPPMAPADQATAASAANYYLYPPELKAD